MFICIYYLSILVANIGFDTAGNESRHLCCMIRAGLRPALESALSLGSASGREEQSTQRARTAHKTGRTEQRASQCTIAGPWEAGFAERASNTAKFCKFRTNDVRNKSESIPFGFVSNVIFIHPFISNLVEHGFEQLRTHPNLSQNKLIHSFVHSYSRERTCKECSVLPKKTVWQATHGVGSSPGVRYQGKTPAATNFAYRSELEEIGLQSRSKK